MNAQRTVIQDAIKGLLISILLLLGVLLALFMGDDDASPADELFSTQLAEPAFGISINESPANLRQPTPVAAVDQPAPTLIVSVPTASVPVCVARMRVLDPEGEGIPDAVIWFGPMSSREPIASAVSTDSTGAWQGQIPHTSQSDDPWSFHVEATGFLTAYVRAPFLPEHSLELGTVRLSRASFVRGRVLTANRRLVTGAAVIPQYVKLGVVGENVRTAGPQSLTDENGEFEIALASAPTQYDLRLTAWKSGEDGPVKIPLGEPTRASLDFVEIVFPVRASLRGTVTEGDGTRLPDVTVSVRSASPPWHELGTVETDLTGAFEWLGSSETRVRLKVFKEGLLHADDEEATYAIPSENVALVMRGASRVIIQAIDAISGGAVDEFEVELCSLVDGTSRCHKLLGYDGVAKADALPAGSWYPIEVKAVGYESTSLPPMEAGEYQTVGPLTAHMIPKPVAGSAAGIVRSPEGEPLEGAHVGLYLNDMVVDSPEMVTVSGADGRFAFQSIPLGEVTLLAWDDDGATCLPVSLQATGTAPHSVELMLERLAQVEGRVWLAPGQPAEGALITFEPSYKRRPTLKHLSRQHAVSDERGAFQLKAPPGRYTVRAWSASHSESDYISAPNLRLELASSERRIIDILMTVKRDIRGTLAASEPTAGWTVGLVRTRDPPGQSDWSVLAVQGHEGPIDEWGRFELQGVNPGHYEAHAIRRDGSSALRAAVVVDASPTAPMDLHLQVSPQHLEPDAEHGH